jgi:hypothetical protein
VLRKSARRLVSRAGALGAATSFNLLYGEVNRQIGSIRGIGPWVVYDTALRIGPFLGLEPEHVYLHRGTREGARQVTPKWRQLTLEVTDLPEAFRTLRPHEIEDCLCVYKAQHASSARAPLELRTIRSRRSKGCAR